MDRPTAHGRVRWHAWRTIPQHLVEHYPAARPLLRSFRIRTFATRRPDPIAKPHHANGGRMN